MKTKTPAMTDSYLIQRLTRPYKTKGPLADLANAFAFGGGLRNGGLSTEAMSMLRELFEFDYMGAAEFEWGAVPKALQRIAAHKDLTSFSFDIPLTNVPASFREKTPPASDAHGTVYVLCPEPWQDEIEGRIRGWASRSYGSRLKEQTRISDALRPDDEYPIRVAGWLELDNGFMFFTDRDMWAGTCRLFDVACPS